jgi:Zinc carboxypeptidase
MKYFFFLLIMNTLLAFAQDSTQAYHSLHDAHKRYRDTALTRRRFRQADLLPLLEKLKQKPELFEVSEIGRSFQGRSISLVKMGSGPTKILLWSQMHGDESTATMALFDIFRFFQADDEFNLLRQQILRQCTLYFVPMLNPDGAEVYQRRTAQGIDMNRDALRTQTPEGLLLKTLQNNLQPDFGFNLHDQSPRYSAGKTGNLATISFLATAYNEPREINEVRKRSMQLILGMNRVLQLFIPNQVGRYSDEFEPRAFGDNIQKWGTTLVLIESGGYANDPEKQYIRQLNFLAILAGMHQIATKQYKKEKIKHYEAIPENDRRIYDLMIRKVQVKMGEKTFVVDVAINRLESPVVNQNYFSTRGVIEDWGDLLGFFGTQEITDEGLELVSEQSIGLGAKADFLLVKGGKTIYEIKNGQIKAIP